MELETMRIRTPPCACRRSFLSLRPPNPEPFFFNDSKEYEAPCNNKTPELPSNTSNFFQYYIGGKDITAEVGSRETFVILSLHLRT